MNIKLNARIKSYIDSKSVGFNPVSANVEESATQVLGKLKVGNIVYTSASPFDSYLDKKQIKVAPDSASERNNEYAYELWYDWINYDKALKYFEKTKDIPVIGACSAIAKGNVFGRNFDWKYNNQAEFVVHTPRKSGRYASIGTSFAFPTLTKEFVESNTYSELYSLVPFALEDGMNEYGVAICMNVVPADKGHNVSIPLLAQEIELPYNMVIRYVLDHFKTATDAVEFLRDHAKIYFSKERHNENYEVHYLISDGTSKYAFEIANNSPIVVTLSETGIAKPFITNFYIYDIIRNADGSVYTPETQDSTHNAIDTNHITEYGAGLERFNYINEAYTNMPEEYMSVLLNSLKYTNAYSTSSTVSNPYWYTEFVGDGLKVNSNIEDFADAVAVAGDLYEHRSRNIPVTWQSVHRVVYNLQSKNAQVCFQESPYLNYIKFEI